MHSLDTERQVCLEAQVSLSGTQVKFHLTSILLHFEDLQLLTDVANSTACTAQHAPHSMHMMSRTQHSMHMMC
jgi:hypothetical protein